MTQRITGRRLQERRERHRMMNPLCVHCQAKGIVRLWDELDHIVALVNGGEDAEDNLQGLCADCHATKTAKDMGHKIKPVIGLDGWPEG